MNKKGGNSFPGSNSELFPWRGILIGIPHFTTVVIPLFFTVVINSINDPILFVVPGVLVDRNQRLQKRRSKMRYG